FETSPVTADWVGFDGGVMTVEAVVAPQSTGNTSTNLAKFVKGPGQVWAGAKIVLDTPFDFSTKSNIEVRIYTTAPIGSKIELKAEQNTATAPASSGAKLAYTTKTGEWETLTFDFSGVANTNLTALIMIPYMPGDAQGDSSEAATFYFDDIVQTAAGVNSSECSGTSSEAQQGTFPADYSYGFETLTNGDVRLTFEMASGTAGLVAYAWKETPFTETPMTVSGTEATLDISGYATGASISYAVKFAWAAGGFGVTKYFSYTVGEDCATASIDKNDLLEISLYPNPAKGKLNISAKNIIESATIYNVLGKKVKSFTVNAKTSSLDVSVLSRGIYILKYTANNAVGSMKFIKE
ncbi:T9SS type A sorting domain-containing protein, partial [Polaribacter sp.]|nr:T9SS type A sorting domain-containing protein [Polaribacter sp.]